MNTAAFTIVRFTVTGSAIDTVLARTTTRCSALQDVEWGCRDTEGGDVFVSPPLRAEDAAALRAVFAGAEGVTEADATGEYVFGYTSAPASYDGFGTLSVSVEGNERLVAIPTEYLTWQAGRYASGIHRFQPVSPAPTSVDARRVEASGVTVASVAAPPAVGAGTVVHMRGRTRRYVVVHVQTFGETRRLSMIALSGSVKGCYPTSVSPDDVERDPDQTVAFTGAAAVTLRRKYDDARRSQIDPPRMIPSP